jgi:anti-sigma factor RsiW/WD40 repeat protein
MNCEQVEERLSAYLDNMLAPDERRALTIHLQGCPRCMMLLAELRQNDILLAQLPRVSPSPTLHERIFSAPEFVELARMFSDRLAPPMEQVWTRTQTQVQAVREHSAYPALVPLQDRLTPPSTPALRGLPAPDPAPLRPAPSPRPPRKQARFPLLKWALAATLVAALCTAALLGLSLRQPVGTHISGAITPPAAGPDAGQAIPLAAGTRFVFLRAGALWSTLVDGSVHRPERLTPADVTVAPGWVVSPPARGHAAGDMLAYVDLKGARVHTIRSDGQQDMPVAQALLNGSAGAASWNGDTGNTILNSLAWSADGSTLAFVGSPAGDGRTHLYLYSLDTDKVQEISPGFAGNIAHPVWSPDGTRLAFTVAHDGVISVLDYNVQSREILNLSNLAAAQGNSTRQVLTLGWSPSANEPAVTWSLGSIGHISSLWIHRVGAAGTLYPQLLLSGDYLQALYGPGGDHGAGGWLLISSVAGRAGDVWHLDLTPGARLLPLSQGRQVSLAGWSPDGSAVFYLDGQNNGTGSGHLVNPATGTDRLLAGTVAATPAPAWSDDGRQLAYSTGAALILVNTINGSQAIRLPLPGRITDLTWFPGTGHLLIVELNGSGLYLVDAQHNTSSQLDHLGADGALQWTEIP